MNSGDYYARYRQKAEEAERCEDQLRKLRSLWRTLTENMENKIEAVNRALDALDESLRQSVRHNDGFAAYVRDRTEDREKSPCSDIWLSAAVQGLEAEISRLERQKEAAQNDRDSFYSQYRQAKEAEERAQRERRERERMTELSRLLRGGGK